MCQNNAGRMEIYMHFRAKDIVSYILVISLITIGLCLEGCTEEAYNAYHIYYMNTDRTTLVTVDVDVADAEGYRLLDEMNTPRKKDDCVVAKPDYVVIEKAEIDGSNVYIYFTDSYNIMDAATEVLYRAAVVKTLTQAEGIEHVTFYVAGLPAVNARGEVMGMMSAGDFIDYADVKSHDIQWSELKLYFTNAKGDKLVPVDTLVAYNKSVPVERVIVEQLINGPEAQGCYRTLPSNLKLLGISITDGTCYVNFDSALVSEMVNTEAMIPIYSVVNSLCELDKIDQVQILVNGESNKMYRESMSLETKFTPDYSLVQSAALPVQPSVQQPSVQQSSQAVLQPQPN